nr:MAG TPA: hypothetical protein [Caudoviricetes sp.]
MLCTSKKCLARSSIKRDSKKSLQISKTECTRLFHSKKIGLHSKIDTCEAEYMVQ